MASVTFSTDLVSRYCEARGSCDWTSLDWWQLCLEGRDVSYITPGLLADALAGAQHPEKKAAAIQGLYAFLHEAGMLDPNVDPTRALYARSAER